MTLDYTKRTWTFLKHEREREREDHWPIIIQEPMFLGVMKGLLPTLQQVSQNLEIQKYKGNKVGDG